MKNIFLSERFILTVILVNAIILFMQEGGISNPLVNCLDAICTLIFVVEMIVKHFHYGVKGYWSLGWNRMDGILVLLSLPSLVSYIIPSGVIDMSFLLILRVLRVFRTFRLAHLFPNIGATMRGFGKALKDSIPVFLGFTIVILVFALLSCALFKEIAPEYFGTPWDSVYSIFRMCTVEGWYDIPDKISEALSPGAIVWIRIYFVLILVSGGIIGLSLVNSIFVDAMVSDNNDNLESEVRRLNEKIDKLTEELSKYKQ